MPRFPNILVRLPGWTGAPSDQLRAALVEAYGEAAEWIDLERLIAEARDPQTKEADFRRYFLNQPAARSDAWIAPSTWAERHDPEREVDPNKRVVLAFDGSYNRDSSALVGCTVGDDPHVFVVGAWERPPGPEGRDWTVPRESVHAAVRRAMETFDVVELACDPFGWHAEMEEWAATYRDVVVEFPTNKIVRMAATCSRFYTAVVTGTLTHDGDPRLARHLANARLRETHGGAYIVKDGRNSPRKIDLAVAAAIAHDRAAWHGANTSRKPERRATFAFVDLW